jgi:hypothetical protein
MANVNYYPLPTWSPLYETPPHPFKGCRSICMLCRAPQGTLADLVAYPLKPELEQGEYFHVAFMKADEIQLPSYTYRDRCVVEFGIPVSYEGLHGGHCALEYFDGDMGMSVGRELWGWPKKMGQLSWTESNGRVHAEVKREGYTLIMVDFEPGEQGAAEPWPDVFGIADDAPYLQVRPTGIPEAGRPAQLDVIRQDVDSTVVLSSTPGAGSLRLFDGPLDPLSFLGPVELVGARFDVYDFDFNWGTVIGTVDLPDAADYAEECLSLYYRLRSDAGFAPEFNPALTFRVSE